MCLYVVLQTINCPRYFKDASEKVFKGYILPGQVLLNDKQFSTWITKRINETIYKSASLCLKYVSIYCNQHTNV